MIIESVLRKLRDEEVYASDDSVIAPSVTLTGPELRVLIEAAEAFAAIGRGIEIEINSGKKRQ